MFLCQVVGSVVSTIKLDCYNNKKIMLVRPISPDGELKNGTMVAVDTVGCGKGEIVLVAAEGRSAAEILNFETRKPLRSVIVAIVDKVKIPPGFNLSREEKTK